MSLPSLPLPGKTLCWLAAVYALGMMLLGVPMVSQASPTIQVYLGGDLTVPDGTVGVLVADRAGNGFHPLNHVTSIGTKLSVGEAIGLSDDVIVGVLQAGDRGFAGGKGFTGILRNLPYPPYQLSPGTPLIFYWFPDHQSPGGHLANGQAFASFRADQHDAGSGGDMAFQLPGRFGVHTLSFVSPADGGGFSILNPGANGSQHSGQTGISTAPPENPGPIELPGTGNPDPTFTDAGFVPQRVGRYFGLISEPGSRFAGEINAYLNPQALVTVRLFLDGRFHVVRGSFDETTGEFTAVEVPGANGPDLEVDLQLATSDTGTFAIVGTVSIGDETLDLVLNHTATPANSSGEVSPGRYTLILPSDPNADPSVIPGGNGFGIVQVLPNGRILANLQLGDGTLVSDATFLDADGCWNLFQTVYGRNNGFIAGQLCFRNEANVSDVDGSVHWKKEAINRPGLVGRYPHGFELAIHAVGSRYELPGIGERLLSQIPDGEDNATWETGGSQLDPAPSSIPVTWLPNNRVLPFNDGNERLQVFVQIATGQVTAIHLQQVTGPNNRSALRRVVTRGIALQKQGIVAGLSLLPQATDSFTLLPAGYPSLTVKDGNAIDLANGATLDFGDIGLDGGIGERLVEISNTGSGNLLLPEAPAVAGEGFALVADRAGYLAPGESSCLRVRFDPNAEGAATGTLTISSNDRNAHPFVLNLTGNGLTGSDNSNIEGGGDSLLTLPTETPGYESTPTGSFDPEVHSGWFRGVVLSESGGEMSLFLNRAGAFSGTARIDGLFGRFRGAVNPDGSLTFAFFRGPLSAGNTLENFELATLDVGNAPAITGVLSADESGDELPLVLVKTAIRNDVSEDHSGRFTMVLPAMEDLGSGYPSGDGIATVFINPGGLCNVRLLLADRQRRAFSTRLDGSGEDLGWSFHQRWALGQISGRVIFADTGEADFQGLANWQRFANPRQRQYQDGFSVEVPVLGSVLLTTPGERLIPIAASESMIASLSGEFDPAVTDQSMTWDARNVFSDDLADDGILGLAVNRATGWVSGIFVKPYVTSEGQNRRQRIRVDGVVFQKQGIITGNADDGQSHGFFGAETAP